MILYQSANSMGFEINKKVAVPRTDRSSFGKLLDIIFFPVRALFMLTEGACGLSSLRDERMYTVAAFCRGRVLDIGCGPDNIFINEFIGREHGIGIDVFPYAGVDLLVEDMTQIPYDDSAYDTITLIAVGGHIPKSKRTAEFKEFARLLKPGGILVMTEGEPVTQFLVHQWAHFYARMKGSVDMDTERGMDQDEEYCMPKKELLAYLNMFPLQLIATKRFMWGLNIVYVAQKTNSE